MYGDIQATFCSTRALKRKLMLKRERERKR